MTISQRAAAVAAFLLCVGGAGTLALASPGAASELAKAALDGSTAASDLPNVPASITVPRIDTTTVTTAKPVPAPDGVHVQMIPAEEVARSEEHTSELKSLMRISYAVFCLKKKTPT